MKIRMDFVTNSSSSSFTIADIDNDILEELGSRFGIDSSGFFQDADGYSPVMLSPFSSIADIVLKLNTCNENEEWDEDVDEDYEALQEGLEYIKKHRAEINAATKWAVLEHGCSVSDDVGSYWQYMTVEDGTISFYSVDESDWDPVKGEDGMMLWQMLERGMSVADELAPFAEEIGNVQTYTDPYYKEKK